jgi:hypothetical protein
MVYANSIQVRNPQVSIHTQNTYTTVHSCLIICRVTSNNYLFKDNAVFAARRELFTCNSTAGMRSDITKRFIDPRDGIFSLRAFVNTVMKHQSP